MTHVTILWCRNDVASDLEPQPEHFFPKVKFCDTSSEIKAYRRSLLYVYISCLVHIGNKLFYMDPKTHRFQFLACMFAFICFGRQSHCTHSFRFISHSCVFKSFLFSPRAASHWKVRTSSSSLHIESWGSRSFANFQTLQFAQRQLYLSGSALQQ